MKLNLKIIVNKTLTFCSCLCLAWTGVFLNCVFEEQPGFCQAEVLPRNVDPGILAICAIDSCTTEPECFFDETQAQCDARQASVITCRKSQSDFCYLVGAWVYNCSDE